MVFVPKKPCVVTADGLDQHTADCTRPLSITCTDNRIICSAVRRHIEPIVGPGISMSQRGFLKYGSMLANILDIEDELIAASLSYADPAQFSER